MDYVKTSTEKREKKRAKEGFNISSLARFGNSPRKNAQTLTRRYSGSLTLHTFFMPPSASNKFSKHREEQQREKRMKRRQWQFNAANNLSILILKAMNHITLLYQYFPLFLCISPSFIVAGQYPRATGGAFFLKSRLFLLLK